MKNGVANYSIGTPIKAGAIGQSIYLKWDLFKFMILLFKSISYN